MRVLPFKSLMDKLGFWSALVVSFAMHFVLVTLAPPLAWNRTTPLQEKNHNKVRITMLKNDGHKPRLENVNLKPESSSKPQKAQRVARVLPRTAKVPAPVARPVTPAQSVALPTPSGRSPLRTDDPAVQVAQLAPKPKSIPDAPQRVADSFRSKRVEPQRLNNTYSVSAKTVVPIERVNRDSRDSGLHNPAARTNSGVRATVKRTDINLKSITPAPSTGSVSPRFQSEFISARSQGLNTVQVASLVPREMTSLNFDESSMDTEITSDALEKIMNEFYTKVGRQIALLKTYPDFARKSGYQGKTLVAFRIDRDGKIMGLSVSQSSGYEVLDEAALKAVNDAGPYPPIPDELNKSSLKFKIPISYALR